MLYLGLKLLTKISIWNTKKMLMKLLEDYQPFMYNHYVQDDVKNYAYLNEVADAILNLNKAFVSGRSEQLISFLEWRDKQNVLTLHNYTNEELVRCYLKEINCH